MICLVFVGRRLTPRFRVRGCGDLPLGFNSADIEQPAANWLLRSEHQ
jgi:hypothetical protein